MKSYILFLIISLIFFSCKTQTKEYPDVTADQIGKKLLWDMNYAQVKKILTEDFNLDFSKENEQNEKKQIGKVYEFTGGKFNGIETKSWDAIFENDSLVVLMINVENDNPQSISQFQKQLQSVLVPDSNSSRIENRWLIMDGGNTVSDVQILKHPENKGIAVAFFKPSLMKY